MSDEEVEPTFDDLLKLRIETTLAYIEGAINHEMNQWMYGEDYLERRRNPPSDPSHPW